MATKLYESFTKNGSVLDICTDVSGAFGVEIAVSGQNKIEGYERLTSVQLSILQSGSPIHVWRKEYDIYLVAGKTYTFYSATTSILLAGTYIVSSTIISDSLATFASVAPSSDSIPLMF